MSKSEALSDLERDALRYRWLRTAWNIYLDKPGKNRRPIINLIALMPNIGQGSGLSTREITGKEADDAIDLAMEMFTPTFKLDDERWPY